MFSLSIKIQAAISFGIFLLIAAKYLLVNHLKLINPYTPHNRVLSYLMVLPLSFIGLLLSIQVVKSTLATSKKNILTYTTILAMPMLLYSLWFLVMVLVSLLMGAFTN